VAGLNPEADLGPGQVEMDQLAGTQRQRQLSFGLGEAAAFA
jgi:hypothetical protein